MDKLQAYRRYTQFLLFFVFIVILAGGIVRMTQSGMGCPDWPTCFGRAIPPTSISQLPPDYEKYLKQQDIDHTFNVYHTWIEYMNRLSGALLGVFILIHVIWSYRKFFASRKRIFWWSLGLLLLTGFQGWLGKKVVDANLAVFKITVHMVVALLIAAIPIIILSCLSTKEKVRDKSLKWLTSIGLLLLLTQIVIGTDVREQVDEISKPLGYSQRELWVPLIDKTLSLHQAMAGLISLAIIGIYLLCQKYIQLKNQGIILFALILATVAVGLILLNFNMPAIAQPAHLLLSSILVISLFNLRLKLR